MPGERAELHGVLLVQVALGVWIVGEEPGEEQVGGVHDAVYGLIGARRVHGVGLGHRFGVALEARRLSADARGDLPEVAGGAGLDQGPRRRGTVG